MKQYDKLRSNVLGLRNCLLMAPLFLVTLLASDLLAQDKTLASQDAIFKKALSGIEGTRFASVLELQKGYIQALGAARKKAQRDGKLEAMMALGKEKTRFETERTVPEKPAADLLPDILNIQKKYMDAVKRSDAKMHEDTVRLANQYVGHLESMKKAYMIKDDIPAAMATKVAIDAVWLQPDVSAAKVAMTAAKVASGTADSTSTSTKQAPVATKFKTLKFVKNIDANGRFSSTGVWLTLPLTLLKGDKVTVKATGAWSPSRSRSSCGPAGLPARSYRSSTRIAPQLPYAALLMRRGNSGTPEAIGKGITFTHESFGLLLGFTMNESPDRKIRKKCSGKISVELVVERPITK